MKFGEALEKLRDGGFVTRTNWAGGVFLFLRKEEEKDHPAADGERITRIAYIAIKTYNGVIMPWMPYVTDMFADDWVTTS